MNALIRQYTPPTCTLEIWGTSSPLSVWAGKNILTDARFELRLDDPRIAEDQQMTLKGDRTQLQLLWEIVDRYVQTLVTASADTLPPESVTPLPSLPSLQPKGLLSHELFLGSLGTETRSSIELSTSQLFDLADSLEAYNAETELLPQLVRQHSRKVALIWTGVTASTLIALGGTVLGLRMYQDQPVATIETRPPSPKITQNLSPLPLPPTGITPPSPRLPATLGDKTPLPTPSGVSGASPPLRPSSTPLVVPPPPSLPPPPFASPSGTAIGIEPQTSGIPIAAPPAPKSDRSMALEKVSPTTMNPNPVTPKLPPLPPLSADNAEKTSPSVAAPTASAPNTNLLDTIPQVAETREYFRARWKPPESLKQTLEYRLVLDRDGSLQQIIPLGQAAKVYLDRTGMPLLHEPFVSPLDIAGNPQLRLVLSPDGTVRTFMEQP